MAYIKKIWKDYPDTTTPILASDMNNIENGIEEIDTGLETKQNNNGWQSLWSTVTFASADAPTFVVTTSIDCTGFVGLGNRLKCTHEGSVKYFLITAITSNSITLYGGTDYTLSATAITEVYYSNVKAPFGFPLNSDKWSVIVMNSIEYSQSNPANGTWYLLNPNLVLNVPIGTWNLGFKAHIGSVIGANNYISAVATLSITNNSETDMRFSVATTEYGTNQFSTLNINNLVTVNSKTPYYLLIKTRHNSISGIYIAGSTATTIIKATSSYL